MTARVDSAVTLLAQVRAGDLTPAQVAAAVRARAEGAHDLNAFAPPGVAGICERAAAAPPGPLHGLPVSVKDSIDTAQLPTTAGTPALAQRRPDRDAAVVAALRRAGAFVAGKNTMHELSFGMTSNNAFTGAPRHPLAPHLTAGGSSGGTAAAVAAGIVPVGLGGDTGGSVRQPAALCGIVGFRPSLGRYPARGVVPLSHSRDTVGILARSVADIALVDAVLAPAGAGAADASPADAAAPGLATLGSAAPVVAEPHGLAAAPGWTVPAADLRLGLPTDYWADLDPGVEQVCRAAAERLATAGVTLVEVELRDVSALADEIGLILVVYEFPRDLRAFLAQDGGRVTLEQVLDEVASPDVQEVAQLSRRDLINDAAYRDGLTRLTQLRRRYADALRGAGVDALLFPTTPMPARPLAEDVTTTLNGREVSTFLTYIRNVNLAGVAGHPAISLPAGHTQSGLPVGLELDGRRGADRDLLRAAKAVETILDAH